jgi:branched-chain amino acid transport system permease protein
MRASVRSGKSPPGVIGQRGLAHALYATAALAAVVAALITPLSAYSLNLLMQAATYAIAVLGLTIVLGYTGQINLAQTAFFGIGAYSVALGTTAFGLSFWGALAIGALLAAGAGAVLGLTSLRLGGHYLAMVTISFQTILTLVLTNWVAFTRGPDGVPNIRRPALLAESGPYLGLCIAALFAVAWFVWRLKTTKLGRAMQAVRDNELAANVIGVDAYATKVAAFTLSAVLGGFGGALFAGGFTYVSPDQFSFAESVVFLTMVLLGGAAAPAGAVLGTGLLILLPEWLRFLKVIYLAVYGGAVILIMIFMPDGIWGYAMTWWRRLNPARPVDLPGRLRHSCGSRPFEALRRPQSGRRGRPDDPPQHRACADRPQRLRQDDAPQRAQRHRAADRGQHRPRRREHNPIAAPSARRPRPRPHFPEHPALWRHERSRQRHRRRRAAAQ